MIAYPVHDQHISQEQEKAYLPSEVKLKQGSSKEAVAICNNQTNNQFGIFHSSLLNLSDERELLSLFHSYEMKMKLQLHFGQETRLHAIILTLVTFSGLRFATCFHLPNSNNQY